NGDFIGIAGGRAEHDTEIAPVGIETEDLADFGELSGQFRIGLFVAEEEGDRFLLILVVLDTDADVAGDLRFAQDANDPLKVRVRGPQSTAGDGAVVDAVYRIHGETKDDVGRIPGLKQKQHRAGIDRLRQVANELRARLRNVRDRGPILVGGLEIESKAELLREGGQVAGRRKDAAIRRGDALQGVAAGHLRNIDEKRRVHVAQLHDVQERL